MHVAEKIYNDFHTESMKLASGLSSDAIIDKLASKCKEICERYKQPPKEYYITYERFDTPQEIYKRFTARDDEEAEKVFQVLISEPNSMHERLRLYVVDVPAVAEKATCIATNA